eukprot:3784530-Prymnesium_polylepis.2
MHPPNACAGRATVMAAPVPIERARRVADLRPRNAITIESSTTVASAAKQMASRQTDAALIVSEATGELQGIFTDSDVTRKVLALALDPATTLVTDAMTKNPRCVRESENAIDALCT